MSVRVFYPNEDGNIVFTQEDLKRLVEDIYEEGYKDGSKRDPTYIPYHEPAITNYLNNWPPIEWTTTITGTNANEYCKTYLTCSLGNNIEGVECINEIT